MFWIMHNYIITQKKKDKIVKTNIKKEERKFKVSTKKKKSKKIKNINKKNNVIDVCTILDKCSIDEISRYLIKIGKKKNFPDITVRE